VTSSFIARVDQQLLHRDNLTLSNRAFAEDFAEFLKRLPQNPDSDMSDVFPASNMQLRDGLFHIDSDAISLTKYSPAYTGEMIKPVTAFMELPPEWNLFLTALAEFHPAIPYAAGMAHKRNLVTVSVHVQDLSQADARLSPFVQLVDGRYPLNDWKFILSPRFNDEYCLEHSGAHSVNYARATGENEVTGYRIAFHDIGRGQSRALFRHSGNYPPYTTYEDNDARNLGFTIVEPEYLEDEDSSPVENSIPEA
jgi:hypothetical protein